MGFIERFKELQEIIDVIPSPVFVKSRDHRIMLLNDSACAFFGHSREELLTTPDFEMFPPEEVAAFRAADDRVFDSGAVDESEEQVTDASKQVRTVITRKRRVQLGDEEYLVAVVTDVTAYRAAEARNRYLAFHDPLTGLPNRALLNERIDQALSRHGRSGEPCVLLCIDLDRFKAVNDTYGHQGGDDLIQQFSGRLSSVVRASDTVARMGGDEFAILLSDTSAGVQAEEACVRILAAASEPFDLGARQAFVGASIGLVATPAAGLSRIELQRRADVALYQAKKEGRGRFRIFSEQLDDHLRRRSQLEGDLRQALAQAVGLEVHYQPLFATKGDTLVAMEALVRWRHPEFGMLQPTEFISIAEDCGLIVPLGEWVLERACRMFQPFADISVAVNLSPVQLRSPGLADRVTSIVRRTGLAPERLQLEVTENAILDIEGGAPAVLSSLRASGIKIVLDDFGTGYSNLTHLQKLEVDKIKIDRSFVQNLGALGDSSAIVQVVANLGRSLGIAVTAEGVETEEQRDLVRSSGCTEIQGFLYSRPLCEEEAIAYLRTVRLAANAA